MGGLTLYLLRHAKSSWDDPSLADFDRTLNKRGVREADWAATLIGERGIRPDIILCSPARRTRATLAPILAGLGDAPIVVFEKRIYEATAAVLLAVLHEQPAEAGSILMIGHNPGFEDLSRRLVGNGDRQAVARLARDYPTAGLATIVFETDAWSDIAPLTGLLTAFDAPER